MRKLSNKKVLALLTVVAVLVALGVLASDRNVVDNYCRPKFGDNVKKISSDRYEEYQQFVKRWNQYSHKSKLYSCFARFVLFLDVDY